MARWLIVCAKADGAVIAAGAADRFWPPASFLDEDQGNNNDAGTRINGTYLVSRLYVRITANGLTAATTIRVRRGVTDQYDLSVPAGISGVFRNDTDSATWGSGDGGTYRAVIGGTGTNITFRIVSTLWDDPANENINLTTHGAPPITWPTSTTEYIHIAGVMARDSADADVQYTVRGSSNQFSHMRIRISSNGINNASTLTFRVNGANGNQTVTVPALTTGDFQDVTNSDAVSSGGQINYQFATGAGGTSIGVPLTQVRSNGPGRPTASSGVAVISNGTLEFTTVEGTTNGSATETDAQVEARTRFEARNYFCRIRGNTLDAVFRSFFRRNGADTGLGIIVPTGLTGVFEHVATRVDVQAADLINYSMDASGASAGTITVGSIGFSQHAGQEPTPPLQESAPGSTTWAINRRVAAVPY